MPKRSWTLSLILLIQFVNGISLGQTADRTKRQPKAEVGVQTQRNMDTLRLDGHRCTLDGEARSNEEAALNRLRNRYLLPSEFEFLTLSDLEKLPQGQAVDGEVVNSPSSDNPNNLRSATLTGKVVDVRMWGCGRRIVILGRKREGRGTESSVCFTNNFAFCTVQIKVVEEGSLQDTQKTFVVKVTARVRKLARMNLLKSNIGPDWSIEKLRAKLLNQRVRFSGWLFYDAGYEDRAWITDPKDNTGKKNSVQTAWGLQPVLAIEVLQADKVSPKPTTKHKRSRLQKAMAARLSAKS